MAGAELLLLADDADLLVERAGGGGDFLGAVAGDDDGARGLDGAGGGERMRRGAAKPASGCSTLGSSEFIRVPWPAASRITATGIGKLLRGRLGLSLPDRGPSREAAGEIRFGFIFLMVSAKR